MKLLGEDNPKIALRYYGLGTIWQVKGDLNKAKSYHQKAYNIFYKTYGAEHSYTKASKDRIAALEKEENINVKTISS